MSVTSPGSASVAVNSGNASTITIPNHVVPSGTELLIVYAGLRNNPRTVSSVDWNTSESLTLIRANSPGDGDDPSIAVFGIVNPTAGTFDVDVVFSGSASWQFACAINYAGGVDSASVAAATNVLEEINNQTNSSTTVFGSAGTSGNALAFAAAMIGNNGHPASNDASFAEIVETDTGGPAAGNGDATLYYGHLLDSAPSAVTLTYNKSDENTGIYFEIVAATAAVGIPPRNLEALQAVPRMGHY